MTPTEREQWLAARRTGIGSSDAPNLVGVGFRDALAVYRDKVEPRQDREPEGRVRRGVLLEALVAAEYERAMGVELAPAPAARHPRHDFLLASPDRVRPDGRRVELKTVCHFGDAWGESGTDRIPDGYLVQVTHQMGVLRADVIDLAALDVDSWELRVYRIARDDRLWQYLRSAATEFWHSHVLDRRPPGPEWDATFGVAKTEALLPVPGKAVELGPDAAELLRVREGVKAVRDEAEAEYKRLTAAAAALMGDAERATCPGWRLKRVAVRGGTYTATREPYARLDVRAAGAKE